MIGETTGFGQRYWLDVGLSPCCYFIFLKETHKGNFDLYIFRIHIYLNVSIELSAHKA